MIKKILLIFAFLLLILPIVFSAETVIFSELFNYNDSFDNHGWTFTRSWSDIPDNPVVHDSDYMDSYVWGWNQTKTPGTSGTFVTLARGLPQNISNGTLTVSYNIDDYGILTDSSTSFQFGFGGLFIVRNGYWTGVNGGVTTVLNGVGGDSCTSTFNYTTVVNNISFQAKFVLEMDIDNNYYNAFYRINDTVYQDIGCSGLTLHDGSMDTLTTINLQMGWQQQTNESKFLDNILISAEITLLLGIGQPCDSDSECASNSCEYGFCGLLGGSAECTTDDQCLSGVCAGGKCTKADLWARIDASKRQQFGDSPNTNNFIALFFMIGLPLFIILSTRSRAGVLGGVAVYFGLGFFFAIVGYLSPFILLGSVIVALLIIVFAFMLGGGNS